MLVVQAGSGHLKLKRGARNWEDRSYGHPTGGAESHRPPLEAGAEHRPRSPAHVTIFSSRHVRCNFMSRVYCVGLHYYPFTPDSETEISFPGQAFRVMTVEPRGLPGHHGAADASTSYHLHFLMRERPQFHGQSPRLQMTCHHPQGLTLGYK